jgi:hypothetical protein
MNDTLIVVDSGSTPVINIGYGDSQTPIPTIQGLALDVRRLDASAALPTESLPFIWNNVAVDTNNIYDPVTGIITFPWDGNFTFNFLFNLNAGSGTDILYAFVRISTDNGVTWADSVYSGRRVIVNTQSQQIIMASTNRFASGNKLQFVFFSTARNTFMSTLNVPQSSAITPASRMMLTGYKI